MPGSVSSWLAKAVVEHDRNHGSNLQVVRSDLKRLVQINQFYTYRHPETPRTQITGQISDKTHVVDVEFDVAATDAFERKEHEQEQETLTANLRSLMIIKSYRWKIGPPRGRTGEGLDMPVLKMEVLDFEIYVSGYQATLFEEAVQVGCGREDGQVQRVLRKWYFGESHSDMSEIDKSFDRSQPEAGPSRLSVSSPAKPDMPRDPRLPQDVIMLPDFLEPYLSVDGAKKGKPIPDWLFEISEVDQQALDEVTIFGLEMNSALENENATSRAVPSPSPSLEPEPKVDQLSQMPKSKGKARAHFPTSSPPIPSSKPSANSTVSQAQTPPFTLAQRMLSTQTATQPNKYTQSPVADNEESDSDGEIPVIPLRQPAKRSVKAIFDPLAFPQSSGEPAPATQYAAKGKSGTAEDEHEVSSDDETDSEGLSDYEREARRRLKRRRASPEPIVPRRASTQTRPKAEIQEDDSIPASESYESYSLTKEYPATKTQATQHAKIEISPSVVHTLQPVVDHGVQQSSLDKNGESLNSNESSLPTPPPSDHGRTARAAVVSPFITLRRVRPVSPKAEIVTPGVHQERTPMRTEVDHDPRDDYEHSGSSKATKVRLSSKRASTDGAQRESGKRARGESSLTAEPSRLSERRLQHDTAGPSISTNRSRMQVIRPKIRYSLDLTIDGLTTDQVMEYIEKAKIAREQLGSAS